jgi:ABC-type nitrate/sulfonate/bicarbonate transport system permease component
MSRRALGLALEVLTPVAVLVAWGVWSAHSGSFYWPPLTDILKTFKDTWLFHRFGSDVVPSLLRMAAGYAIAVSLGVVIGVPLGMSERLRRAAGPTIEFLRAIPPPALVPAGIIIFGIGDSMKVFIIALVCLFPVLLNAIDGVRSIDPTFTETSRVYGIGGIDRLRFLTLPAAMPQIFAGMRTSLSLALILMVISEMVASTNGIGYFVLQSQRQFAIPEMWAGILLLGLLGYLLNLVFLVVERRVLRWHRGARAIAEA